MQPAVYLPGKDDVIAGAPEELMLRCEFVKDASLSWFRAPDFMAFSSGGVGYADRPGLSLTMWLEVDARRVGRHAHEGNVAAVRRPDRTAVDFGRGIKVAK